MTTAPRTRPAALEGDPQNGKLLMKFNPEITTGTIIQTLLFVGTLAVSFGAYKEDQTKQDGRSDKVEVLAAKDREDTKEALREIKIRLDEQQRSMQDVKESLAVLRGRSTDGSRK